MFWGFGVRGDIDPRQSRNSSFNGRDPLLTLSCSVDTPMSACEVYLLLGNVARLDEASRCGGDQDPPSFTDYPGYSGVRQSLSPL